MFPRRTPLAAVLVLALATSGPARPQAPPFALDECRDAIDRNPADPGGYYCIYRWVLAGGDPDRAVPVLQEYFERYPRAYRAQMFIAWIDRIRQRDDWRETLGRAVDGMESVGDHHGVVYGGLMLAYELENQGAFVPAAALLDRCERAAGRTGDPIMEARVWVGLGALAMRRGDYSQDLHLLRRAERVVFPDGPYDIRSTVAKNLGSDYWYLGRYRNAYEAYRRASRIREEAHDLWWQAITVYDMALCAQSLMERGEMSPDTVDGLLRKGLALAVASRNAEIEAALQVLMGNRSRGEAARSHHRRALELARRNGYAATEILALEGIGNSLAEEGTAFRDEAARFLEEAAARARRTGQLFLVGKVMASRARLEALSGTPQRCLRQHLRVLDFIEGLRTPRVRGPIRAQAFSRWDSVYYRLAGLLLSRAESSPLAARYREVSFRTMERFRARELLESLHAPRRVSPDMATSEPYRRRREVLQRISEIQRRLADPELDPAGREAALLRLSHLEEDESRLRDELQRLFPPPDTPFRTAIPGLSEIQALLAPDQAILSYQLWDGEDMLHPPLPIGASWLLGITRTEVRALRLPPRRELRAQVDILEGLLQAEASGRMDGTAEAAASLGGELLGGALAALPENIRRLVIVPDDVLSRCPFALLSAGPGGASLLDRYQVSLVPSAAVWAHLKRRSAADSHTRRAAALILYSPAVEGKVSGRGGLRAAGPWREGIRLAPLPHAAREARALRRAAGRGTRLLTGGEASEKALKCMELGGFGILDLVTHAVEDPEQPERSAIILAPGCGAEDGFLQVREIPELRLDGQLVILSSCSSSAWRILGGEGAQSLARAFLEAGAGAVLASLWPMEDGQAAAVFAALSRELGRGRSVAQALRLAQMQARAEGMPAAGWAGVVALGDGDLAPLPAHPRRWPPWGPLLVLLVVATVAVFTWSRILHGRWCRGGPRGTWQAGSVARGPRRRDHAGKQVGEARPGPHHP